MSGNAARIQTDESYARAEQPLVDGVARILAVVPSLGPASRAWNRLGFRISEPFERDGCRAADLSLAGTAIRFLAPDYRRREHTALASLVDDRLILGAGILGWSWACTDVEHTRAALEIDDEVLRSDLTPGVTTLLENAEEGSDGLARHANSICAVDHVLLGVSDADAAADVYARNFGLGSLRRTMADRRYASLQAGESAIEIVGPASAQRGPVSGHAWGLAFRSSDLDATVATLRARAVDVPDPQSAVRNGRVVSLPIHLGGIGMAFVGE